jgi:hypothetical protein
MFSHHDMVHCKKQSQLYQVNCSFGEQWPFDFGLAPFPLWLAWAWVLSLDPLRAFHLVFFCPLVCPHPFSLQARGTNVNLASPSLFGP